MSAQLDVCYKSQETHMYHGMVDAAIKQKGLTDKVPPKYMKWTQDGYNDLMNRFGVKMVGWPLKEMVNPGDLSMNDAECLLTVSCT